MNSTIRKLPGSKKEFAHVKSVVDHRRPGSSSKAPNVTAAVQIKPHYKKPSSGKAVSANEIARPLTARPPWDSSTKIKPTPVLYIKPLPSTRKALGHVQRKSFKARSIPASHSRPFRPVLPSKMRQPTGKPKAHDKSVSGQTKPDNKLVEDVDIKPVEMTPESPKKAPQEMVEIPDEKATDVPAGSADPGFMSRVWHSMVDPILSSKKPNDEAEAVAVKQPESEESGVPVVTEEESPAIGESAVPSVAENKEELFEMAIEAVGNQPMEGPSSVEGEGRKYPKGYGSKKERIRKALEKKGIMPGDELPPKKPFKSQGPKGSKSPSLQEIFDRCVRAQQVYKNSG
ncbi:Uncharacterized protein APZ42_034002 [Daphnia magna]|uniref:Uncharacterized protein n=1 Tax=Daphnia magna TaxID=35525 RepID=A0A164KJ49_9CRUS|nr:Uncharacterized protein APZ42_034002 [Daphnia magna]